MSAPSRTAVLGLYRTLIRSGAKFVNYNFREYTLRRVREGFAQNAHLSGTECAAVFAQGQRQAELIHRQVVVGNFYSGELSVMDIQS